DASELRLLYQLYEEAQRSRIAHGERLRAILQGRSPSQLVGSIEDADPIIKAIGEGQTAGAPRILERAYSRAVDDEAAAADALSETIEQHPAWPWLSSIRGIGHLLAARLLSRLDVHPCGDAIGLLGILRTGDDSGDFISVFALPAGSCISGWLSGSLDASDSGWEKRVSRRARESFRRAANARRSASQRAGRTRQL
ncbi:MAG TPA: hypothetical protein VK571_09480, partial [Gemmatimonadaceae bacterium]|nr:hypothetical protein [Gemmatimonadaceae bacterium]